MLLNLLVYPHDESVAPRPDILSHSCWSEVALAVIANLVNIVVKVLNAIVGRVSISEQKAGFFNV